MSQVAVAPSQQLRGILLSNGLEEDRAMLIAEKFNEFLLQGNEWAERAQTISVTSCEQVVEMKQAREGRLFLKQRRVSIENLRKDLKDRSLKEGRAIDMIAKHLTGLIEPTERYLEEQERFPIREQARLRRVLLDERYSKLGDYDADDVNENVLAIMSEHEFAVFLDAARVKHEAGRAERQRQREEKEEEGRRQTLYAAERERLRRENEALNKEVERAQNDFNNERQQRQRLQSEIQAEHQRQLQLQDDEREQQRQDSLASDRDKALKFATSIAKLHIPDVQNDEAQAMIAHAHSLLIEAQAYLEKHANKL